jgi:hypothetical protein
VEHPVVQALINVDHRLVVVLLGLLIVVLP